MIENIGKFITNNFDAIVVGVICFFIVLFLSGIPKLVKYLLSKYFQNTERKRKYKQSKRFLKRLSKKPFDNAPTDDSDIKIEKIDLRFEKKKFLSNIEIRKISRFIDLDFEYFGEILGTWDPQKSIDERYPIILIKTHKKISHIVGWIYYTDDNYRISHYIGRKMSEFLKCKNAFVFHIYIRPKYRDNIYIFIKSIEEIENRAQNIWLDTYNNEFEFIKALGIRNYLPFNAPKSGNWDGLTWYKGFGEDKTQEVE